MQLIFFFGINANLSQILCKFLAITQHYLHLAAYLWLLIAALHLYRMLTELRDINKPNPTSKNSHLPLFYYILALGLPAICVSLTLAIKQEIYTNFSLFGNLYETTSNTNSHIHGSSNNNNSFANFYISSVYCWLCVTNYYEIFYVLILPLAIIFIAIICLTRETTGQGAEFFLYLKPV